MPRDQKNEETGREISKRGQGARLKESLRDDQKVRQKNLRRLYPSEMKILELSDVWQTLKHQRMKLLRKPKEGVTSRAEGLPMESRKRSGEDKT